MAKRFKAKKESYSGPVKPNEPRNYDNEAPLFSLERVQSGKYCFASLDQENKAMFAEAIFRRKSIAWKEIKQIDRHGLGTEKIAKSCIKTAIPRFITEDFEDFLAFRYHGLHPIVGYRDKNVFFVLWFDHDFTLYAH
ncbi:MAG: hypothetical protein HRT35_03505 [Algicola sp.]|nr:hypothetical protein [Algicola sp.]